VGNVVDLVGDNLAQFVDAFTCDTGSRGDLLDLGIFLFEGAFFEVEGIFVVAVADNDYGRVAAVGFNVFVLFCRKKREMGMQN
jgi:hypothetical protein